MANEPVAAMLVHASKPPGYFTLRRFYYLEASMRTKITKRSVEAISPEDKYVVAWDSEVPGFGVKVTPKEKRI